MLGVVREAGAPANEPIPYDLQLFALRRVPRRNKLQFSVIKNTKYRLESLLQDSKALQVLQSKSTELQKLRKAIEEEVVNFPKRDEKFQKMLDDDKAELVDGVIYLTETVEGVARKVIPLPQQSAPIAIAATHETVGHRSVSQLVTQVRVNFHFQRVREMVTAFVDSCVRCSLEKGGSNFTRRQMKPIPLPEGLFTTIVMDEMVRSTKGGETVRFLVAMEVRFLFFRFVVQCYDTHMFICSF